MEICQGNWGSTLKRDPVDDLSRLKFPPLGPELGSPQPYERLWYGWFPLAHTGAGKSGQYKRFRPNGSTVIVYRWLKFWRLPPNTDNTDPKFRIKCFHVTTTRSVVFRLSISDCHIKETNHRHYIYCTVCNRPRLRPFYYCIDWVLFESCVRHHFTKV
jgi:hypothetical protein